MVRTEMITIMMKESIFDDLMWWSLEVCVESGLMGELDDILLMRKRRQIDGEVRLCSLVSLSVERLGSWDPIMLVLSSKSTHSEILTVQTTR
jgi:hypothetical protein